MSHPSPASKTLNPAFSRIMRLLAGALGMVAFFSGASAAPRVPELTQTALEARLAREESGLGAFVARLERSLRAGDLGAAEEMMDREAILTRAMGGVKFEGADQVRDIFSDSTHRAWDQRGLTRDYVGTNFRFLRPRSLGGRAGLLFRATSASGGLNYTLFVVNECEPGQYRVADIFVVGLNEYLSDTLRRTFLNVAGSFLGGESMNVPGVNAEYVAHINEVSNVSRLLNSGRYQDVLDEMKRLPAAVQRERGLLLMRLDAAEKVSNEERAAAYTAWTAVYPDEMSLPLKLADFYASQRRWSDAERIIRELDARLGGDNRLQSELGTVLFRRDQEREWVAAASLTVDGSVGEVVRE